ncbi:hypothetical protein Tco_0715472 [Tanacetum coccineum]
MSAITDIRCAFTRKAFDAFCTKYHIPKEVHPVLSSQNDTIHERPAGKIGFYTRFFDYANFRLPLSSFLVDVLRHFRINISQLFVIGAAKFPKEFLCLVGLSRHYTLDEKTYPLFLDKDGDDMNIFAFIHTPDPTKVKVAERQRVKGEPRLLETTVGRTVPLLPVAPDRAEGELKASVDKLFDEGSSRNQTDQGDSAGGGGGGEGVIIQPVIEVVDVAENVAPAQPRRQKKRKTLAVDAGGPSHPPKKLSITPCESVSIRFKDTLVILLFGGHAKDMVVYDWKHSVENQYLCTKDIGLHLNGLKERVCFSTSINCTFENQVKFATYTLHSVALTWWNTHVKTVGHDAAYEMKIWDLKVKGADLTSYTQPFQELALLYERMFPKESDKIKKYVSGLPDMIHRSVVASKPKTMQDAVEIATELMDKKIHTFAEC